MASEGEVDRVLLVSKISSTRSCTSFLYPKFLPVYTSTVLSVPVS